MKIPQLHIGHTHIADGKDIIVKNAVYKNEQHLESNFPHKHSFYMICLIRSGSGIHVVDFEEIATIKNRLFIVYPMQVHFWKLDSDTDISLIQFSESLFQFEDLHKDCLFSPNAMVHKSYIDLKESQVQKVLDIFLKIETETNSADTFSTNIIRGYLQVLSGLTSRFIDNSDHSSTLNQKTTKIREFTHLVNHHFQSQKSVSYYAGKLNISANYLNMLSQQILGKNAGDVITSRIMLEAKRLLYHTSDDISQIAFGLGFDDPSYFSRFFRKTEKISPTEFRELIYKKYRHPNN